MQPLLGLFCKAHATVHIIWVLGLLLTCTAASLKAAPARALAQAQQRSTAASSPSIINLQDMEMAVEYAWQLIPPRISNAVSQGGIILFSPLQINDSHLSLHDCLKKINE